MKAKRRYTNGLDKLAFAESQVRLEAFSLQCFLIFLVYSYILDNIFLQVGMMKKELIDLQPKLEQAKIENNNMMKVNTFHHLILALLILTVYTSMFIH